MPTLADLVAAYTRTPTATCYLDGKRWHGARKFSYHQKFKEQIETGTVEGKSPPTVPRINMEIRWAWGYNGIEVAGFKGYVSDTDVASYPYTEKLQCSGVLWLADQNNEVLQTDPLNEILASDAARYLLTHYGNIPASRLNLPILPASGSAWAGSEWTLGILTPVQWGDIDQQSGGTTAMRAAAEIYGGLGYWLYALPSGTVTAKQMERKPSPTAREVFRRDLNLLVNGAPERRQSYNDVYSRVTVRGADTGVDGAQLYDQRETTHPLLRAGVHKDFSYSSFLLEYENSADAGAASITEVAKRILNIVSRIPDVVPLRAKADPNRKVGDTAGIVDTGIRLSTQKNYFIYQIDRTLDLDKGAFDDALLLDGGTGSTGYTTVPPPDASFSWLLDAETLDGDAVVVVALDGSGSTSPSGEIVSWAWSTATTTYGGTPNSATGINAMFIFLASDSPATITLTVTDTTSKTGTFSADIDLTGADTQPPFVEVVSAAAGAAWYVTTDGGATWNTETSNGDAVAVGTIGAGADDRGAGTGATYGLLATRGSGGAGGLRQTLDTLASASANLVSNSGAITSNIWVNEANPSRVWFAIGPAVYRSTDGGATKTAMHAAPATVTWIMEDPAVDNSIFLLAGANMYNATDPTVGYALLYSGPIGSTARQFVRSRDGQVTWIAYTGAPAGEALQRVETGALADFSATDCRTLALDKDATNLRATLYAVTGDDPAEIWRFDGLTGLDAAQSTQTFPSGATVQHMLGSRQTDLIYTADFDSVALGQGALRKYLIHADQLLLWKELASGQQGHMLGLGSAGAVAAAIILLPYGESGAADKIWFYDPQTRLWTGKTPPEANKTDWFSIAANPFDPRKLLLLRRLATSTGASTCDNALWYSDDYGDTWTNVWTNITNGTNFEWRDMFAAWSPTFGNEWISGRRSGDTSILIRGVGATYTEYTISTSGGDNAHAHPALAGEAIYVLGDSSTLGYMDDTNTPHTSGVYGTFPLGALRTLHGTRQVAHVPSRPVTGIISVNSDYHGGSWAVLSGSNSLLWLGILADGAIVAGNGGAIDEYTDAWGAAVRTQITTSMGGDVIAVTDKQTQTVAAALMGGAINAGSVTAQPLIRTGLGAWTPVPRPPLAGNLAWAIEVIGETT